MSLFSSNKPHNVGQCAKWAAWGKNTKKPSSLVVWAWAGEVIALVYIKIKAEKWETAVYILGGLFSVFPSTPRKKVQAQTYEKCTL